MKENLFYYNNYYVSINNKKIIIKKRERESISNRSYVLISTEIHFYIIII